MTESNALNPRFKVKHNVFGRIKKKLIQRNISRDWNQKEINVDPEWYDQNVLDEDTKRFLGESESFHSGYGLNKNRTQKSQKKNFFKLNSKQVQDIEKYEQELMIRSGIIKKNDERFINKKAFRINLIVRNIYPPFLDGREIFSKQVDSVSVMYKETSYMSIVAKNGSEILKKYKEKTERFHFQKLWEVKGTKTLNLILEEKSSEKKGKYEKIYKYKKNINCKNLIFKFKDEPEQKLLKCISNKQRKYLPIYFVRSKLIQVIQDNQIVILVGETGSGKTTQLTQYLLEEGFSNSGMIICTQPRRVAAMSIAKRVSEERKCILGSEVGYSIRFENCTSKYTKIKYCTDGVLLREILKRNSLDKYNVVIMDEAHERSLHTDILFSIFKKYVKMHFDLKIIVTSATLESEKFSNFFGNCPIFKVPGRTFKVDTIFSRSPCKDYVYFAVKTVIQIHLYYEPGDILVFMTGQADINCVCSLTAERLRDYNDKESIVILPIYSQLPSDLQENIFKQTKDGTRKCIVATNIAETSLTVDGIKYIIDCGYCKLKVFQPLLGIDSLKLIPISRANANQRSGRAGRTNPGIAFRLYTLIQYEQEMLETTVPEIQRTSLGNIILLLKSLGINDLLKFEFIDPPPQETMISSMHQLWMLGALDNVGFLTKLGKKMILFPLDPPLSKMLIYSLKLRCNNEIMTIVAILSVPSIFFRSENKTLECEVAREKFYIPESDHLTFLNTYIQWEKHSYSTTWCLKNYVHSKALRKVREIRNQLKEIMKQEKMKIFSSMDNWDVIRKAITSAYFSNACKIKSFGEYINLRKGISAHLHPSSAMYGTGYNPDYVVYHELVMTNKEFMRHVLAIDPIWLTELAPFFFGLKENKFDRKFQKEIIKQLEEEHEIKLNREAKLKKDIIEKKKKTLNVNYIGVGLLKDKIITRKFFNNL